MSGPDHIVVIDNGSSSCKAGFAGNDAPTAVFPTITGRLRQQLKGVPFAGSCTEKNVYVGDEAFVKRGILDINYPVQSGLIIYWDGIEKIWDCIFHEELRVDPKDCLVLLADPHCGPRHQRSKMTEIIFEKFQVAEFYVSLQTVLALYASGRTTGTVLDCGDEVTHAVSIYEGYSLPHTTKRLDFAGRELTDCLMEILNTSSTRRSFTTLSERDIVNDIKEKCCYVSVGKQQQVDCSAASRTDILPNMYKLPDGSDLKLGNEQFLCPECLFKPSLCIGRELPGVQDIINQSVMACDVDLSSKLLYNNIVLTGGSTCFSGLPERLTKELETLSSKPVQIIASDKRKYGAWVGGSILGSLTTFRPMWITKAEYDEAGPDVVHRKCF